MRDCLGRFCIITNGASMPCPMTILPVMRVALSDLIFSMPPWALM
jgi:hypothetical protein